MIAAEAAASVFVHHHMPEYGIDRILDCWKKQFHFYCRVVKVRKRNDKNVRIHGVLRNALMADKCKRDASRFQPNT